MSKPVWKEINGFPSYEVSTNGDVRNIKRGINKRPMLNEHGYHQVTLYKDGKPAYKKIHRLVAEAFIDNPESKPIVNHKDGCKCNNCVSNLEWATQSENIIHAYKNNLIPRHASMGMLGKKNPNAGAKGRRVRIVETCEEFKNIAECSRLTGISDRRICDVLNGKLESVQGFHFEEIT